MYAWLIHSVLFGAAARPDSLNYSAADNDIRLAAFFPLLTVSGELFSRGSYREVLAASLLAVEHFNARDGSVCRDFAEAQCGDLHASMVVADTFGLASKTLEAYHLQLSSGRIDAIVGPALTSSCVPLGVTCVVDATPSISYASTSSTLSQKVIYPFLARVLPPDTALSMAAARFFHDLGWQQVGVLYANDDYGQSYALSLRLACGAFNLTCDTSPLRLEDPSSTGVALHSLRSFAVIFAVIDDEYLPALVQEVTARNLYGPERAWFWSDAVTPSALEALCVHNVSSRCLVHGSGRILSTGAFDGDRGKINLASAYARRDQSVDRDVLAFLGVPYFEDTGDNATILTTETARYGYDAVAALVLAACRLRTLGFQIAPPLHFLSPLSIGEFAWLDEPPLPSHVHGPTLLAALHAGEFEGASGTVRFDINGDRADPSVAVENWLVFDGSPPTGTIVATLDAGQPQWHMDVPFVFYDNSTNPMLDTIQVTCEPGYFVAAGEDRCQPCAPGYYKPDTTRGPSVCFPCDGYSYAEHPASVRCTACGRNSRILDSTEGAAENGGSGTTNGHTSRRNCTCEDNSYTRAWPVDPEKGCASCRDLRARCPGGTCQPYPKKGYWTDWRTTYRAKTYRCRYVLFCPGGRQPAAHAHGWLPAELSPRTNRSNYCLDYRGIRVDISASPRHWCAPGRNAASPMCSNNANRSDKPYFQVSNLSWRCPKQVPRHLFTALCWFVLAALFVFINDFIRPRYRVLNIVMDVWQDLGLILVFRFQWPASVEYALIAFSIALLDVDT